PPFTAFKFKTEIVHLCSVYLHSAKPSQIDLYRDHFSSVSVESNSASAETSQYSTPQILQKTLRRLKKTRSLIVNNSRSSDLFCTDNSVASSNSFAKPGQMENNDRTLKELATPDVLEPAQIYELKSGLIHLLPKFHGLAGEDPHKHMKEFHVVCSTMRP
ncbi:hypothetical protein CR513_10533, partial [Mucuna pruriens]